MRLRDRFLVLIPRQMWLQMAIVMALVVIIPLVGLGMLLIGTSEEAMSTAVRQKHGEIAVRAAAEVNAFVKRARDLLTTTSTILGTVYEDAWKQETVLAELALNQEIFGRISSVGANGMEWATSELGTALSDRSGQAAFQQAIAGKFYMSEMYISEDRLPFVSMAVPVKRLGEFVGVLTAEVNLRGMWDIVDQIRVGETGRAYVVGRNGVLIAHPDKKKVIANEDLSGVPAVHAALNGGTGTVEHLGDERERWLSSFAPMTDLGWGMIIQQSAEEAFAFSRIMKTQSWILICFSLLFAVLVSLGISGRLVRPIRTLMKKTRRVAEGDLDQQVTAERRDEIGELMRSFNDMIAKLRRARETEKLGAIGKAAAAIAHDLKNALVMVHTFVQLFPKKHKDEQFVEKFCRLVPRELDNWKEMLQDLSDYARQTKFKVSLMRIDDWADDLALMVEERAAQLGLGWTFRRDITFPPVMGNEQKLKQALMNIITNAMDAMPGGGQLELSIRAIQRGTDFAKSTVEICVKDTGEGIPAEVLSHIFDPFYSTKASGLGLGLSISREIIEHHGGSIRIESEPGKGTSVMVRLPVHQAALAPA